MKSKELKIGINLITWFWSSYIGLLTDRKLQFDPIRRIESGSTTLIIYRQNVKYEKYLDNI